MPTPSIGQLIQSRTSGRPYVFVIMKFRDSEKDALFHRLKNIIDHDLNMACLRGDDVLAGQDLLAKVHGLIDGAEAVIADVATDSHNVFYEIGYSKAKGKPILFLGDETKLPADLRGLDLMRLADYPEDSPLFAQNIVGHLKAYAHAGRELLRSMLLGPAPRPSYIVAGPKYPSEDSKIPGQVPDRRTFGDNLGIRGLVSAFGNLLGEHADLELVSAQNCAMDLIEQDVNLYLIGSGRVNPLATPIMHALLGESPLFEIRPEPGREHERDSIMRFYIRQYGGAPVALGENVRPVGSEGLQVHVEDWGLVLRGPHPHRKKRIALLLAGAHSLGTGAACLAATRSGLIERIERKLAPDVTLADKHRTIWALVKGHINDADGHLDEDGVTVCDAGAIG